MRQQFYTKTIQSDFIKSLLYNTPLPICNCVSLGDYLIKGHSYIFNRQIIRCTDNGYLRPELQRLQINAGGNLGLFILGYSTLGFGNIITERSFGGHIAKDKYYLLGQYDLRYGLEEGDPDYNYFSTQVDYSIGDIVIQKYQEEDCLYIAINNMAHGIWNPDDWQFIQAEKGPYQLIFCTQSGRIGDKPAGATYKFIQEFQPEVFKINDNQYLSGRTYYIVQEPVTGSITTTHSDGSRIYQYVLVYNDYPGYLSDKIAKYDYIDSYIPETYYKINAEKYLSPYDYYDSDTHKQLGKLLRFYRAVYQLDLMPYYNCWDGSYLGGFVINPLSQDILVETNNTSAFKIIKVPIKFNRKYTIAMDCSSEVKMMPALIKLNDKLKVKLGIGNDIDLCDKLMNSNKVTIYNQLTFNRPIVFEVENKSEESLTTIEGSVDGNTTVSQFFQRYENDLYLLIQVPSLNDSSVVVLEGDYTAIKTNNIFNVQYLNSLSQEQINHYLLSDLSLIMMNDKISYPFADRLVEYLLENVINSRDEIGEDIVRVRQKLNGNVVYDPNITAWDEYLRKTLYDLYMSSTFTTKMDISGFVDKDVEKFIDLIT